MSGPTLGKLSETGVTVLLRPSAADPLTLIAANRS